MFGISWDQFPSVYAGIALIALLVSVVLRQAVVRVLASGAVPAELRPTEIGMLMSPKHALLAAMAQASATGLIDRTGLSGTLTRAETARLDPLTVTVTQAFADPRVRKLHAVAQVSQTKLQQLQTDLVDRGLLSGSRMRWQLFAATSPALLAVLFGIAGFFGTPNGFLDVLVILLEFGAATVAYWYLVRPPRLTAAGRKVLRREQKNSAFLHPTNRPALRTYGVKHSAMAAALYGGAALWLLDAPFANATQISQNVDDGPVLNHVPLHGATSVGGSGCSGGSAHSCGGSSGCSSGGCGGGGGGGCGGGGCGG